MPTFRRIAAPLAAAGIVGAALTGVLYAQTAPNTVVPPVASAIQAPSGNSAEVIRTASAGAAERDAPASLAKTEFNEGLEAFRAGNMADAISHWEVSAANGHLGAQWNLVRIFSGQTGEAPDPSRRLHYLHLAAAQHDPDAPPGPRSAIALEALVELGLAYRSGVPEADMPAQPIRARGILEHAASLYSHPRAQYNLGQMYMAGEGMRADTGRALRWLFLAASKEHAPAQAALGDYFWKRGAAAGAAGTDDRMRGLMWLARAGENARSESAKSELVHRFEQAVAELNADDRQRFDELVVGWQESRKSAALELTQ